MFNIYGKLVGHLPVCGWLRVATAFIKRTANSSTSTWNEEICDEQLRAMLEDTTRRVKQDDLAKSRWYFVNEVATVRVDASALAPGVAIEVDGHVVEDASWLRANDASSHINMAELAQFADTVRRLATPATTRHCQGYIIQQSEYWCTSSVGHRRSCSRTMTRRSAVMQFA